MRHPAQRQGVVPAPERLQHHAAGHQVGAGAAILLRHGDAEQAGRADGRERLVRPPLLGVHALAERIELVAREAVGLVEDLGLLRGQPERVRRRIRQRAGGMALSNAHVA